MTHLIIPYCHLYIFIIMIPSYTLHLKDTDMNVNNNETISHKIHDIYIYIYIYIYICIYIYDADTIPLFVASNLSNLPPITFDSIDVSVLLTKLERLTDQVAMLQTGLAAQTTVTENSKGLYVNAVSRINILETHQHTTNTDVGIEQSEQSVIC